MNNSPQIALGKSDASLLRTIPEFRVTRNSRSMYHGAQCIKDENGPLMILSEIILHNYDSTSHKNLVCLQHLFILFEIPTALSLYKLLHRAYIVTIS